MGLVKQFIRAKEKGTKVIQRSKRKKFGLVFNFARMKQKRPGCSKIWHKRSEAKGISPTLSKSKVKRIGVSQKFAKTNKNEVKPFKILQNRSKTNIFVSDCEEEEKRKKTKLRFFWSTAKKNEYNRSATIEDLPLLLLTTSIHSYLARSHYTWAALYMQKAILSVYPPSLSELLTTSNMPFWLVTSYIWAPYIFELFRKGQTSLSSLPYTSSHS